MNEKKSRQGLSPPIMPKLGRLYLRLVWQSTIFVGAITAVVVAAQAIMSLVGNEPFKYEMSPRLAGFVVVMAIVFPIIVTGGAIISRQGFFTL